MFRWKIYFTSGQTQTVWGNTKQDAISNLTLNNMTEDDVDFCVKL